MIKQFTNLMKHMKSGYILQNKYNIDFTKKNIENKDWCTVKFSDTVSQYLNYKQNCIFMIR